MMMMIRRFVERILNSPQTRCPSQSNRWDLRCRANARGDSVAVRREAARMFQICGPATAKLFIPSVVVLGTNSVPVSADRRCRLLTIAEIAWYHSRAYPNSQAHLQQDQYQPKLIHAGICNLSWRACTWSSGELGANKVHGAPEWCGRTFVHTSPPEQLHFGQLEASSVDRH